MASPGPTEARSSPDTSSDDGAEAGVLDVKPLLRHAMGAQRVTGTVFDGAEGDEEQPEDETSPRAPTSKAGLSFDAVLDEVGDGRFQNVQVAILGLGNSADAIEILVIGYALSVYPETTAAERGALTAAVFAGMLVGGVGLGILSDRIGRRNALILSLVINAVSGLASAFSPHTYVLTAIRALAGLGIGGSVPCVFTLAAEISPSRSRGWYLNLVAWMWMFGSLFVVSVSWVVLGQLGASWRVLLAVTSLPAFLVAALTACFVHESPRWLHRQGRHDDAVSVLTRMARENGRPADWIGRTLLPATKGRVVPRRGSITAEDVIDDGKATGLGAVLCGSLGPLFGPTVRRTSVLLLVCWFTLAFANYGLLVWITEIFDAVGFHVSKYQDAFLVSASTLPGNIAAALLLDRIGRRRVLSGAMLGACLCAVGFAFLRVAPLTVAFACAFNAFSVAGWNALDCLTAESFPTDTRAAGMGLMAASGRVGSMAAQFVNASLVETSVALMFVVMASAMLTGSLSGAALPFEPSKQALTDEPAPNNEEEVAIVGSEGRSKSGVGSTA